MKANYLKGLSHVLNHLPRPVLVTELPTVRAVPSRGTVVVPRLQGRELLMPPVSSPLQLLSLLLEALSCSDRVVQLSTLSCLQPLLLEAPQIMSLHVDTLVTKFLSLTSSPAMVRAPLSCTVLPGPAPLSPPFPHRCVLQAVRIAALRCAHALTSLPTIVVSAPAACPCVQEAPGGHPAPRHSH